MGLVQSFRISSHLFTHNPRWLLRNFSSCWFKKNCFSREQISDVVVANSASALVAHSRYNKLRYNNSGKGNSGRQITQDTPKNRWRKNSSNYSKSNNKISCQLCDTFGHSAKTCWKALKALTAPNSSIEHHWGCSFILQRSTRPWMRNMKH